MACPKCHYERKPTDQGHPDLCPACGIAINKWRPVDEPETAVRTVEVRPGLVETLLVPARDGFLWPRAGLWLALLLWTGWFAMHGIDWEVIGGSFMHNINLPFHEFGHVAFSPFGRFMAILGGSLFQLILPLGLAAGFVLQQHNNFAGSVCCWWCGQSFVDLAPYIQDAPYRALPLVAGMGEEAHDWGNLLTMTNSLHWAKPLANISFFVGLVLMGLALYWGYQLLRKQKQAEAV